LSLDSAPVQRLGTFVALIPTDHLRTKDIFRGSNATVRVRF
jgi:hypothetical protein